MWHENQSLKNHSNDVWDREGINVITKVGIIEQVEELLSCFEI